MLKALAEIRRDLNKCITWWIGAVNCSVDAVGDGDTFTVKLLTISCVVSLIAGQSVLSTFHCPNSGKFNDSFVLQCHLKLNCDLSI